MKKIVIFASGSGSSAENIFQKFGENGGIDVVKLYCNNPNAYVLKRFEKQFLDSLARDSQGNLVYLPANAWRLERTIEDWPEIQFLQTMEIN